MKKVLIRQIMRRVWRFRKRRLAMLEAMDVKQLLAIYYFNCIAIKGFDRFKPRDLVDQGEIVDA